MRPTFLPIVGAEGGGGEAGGVCEGGVGDVAEGDADIAAAVAADPQVVGRMKQSGISP